MNTGYFNLCIFQFKPAIFSATGKEYFMILPNRDASAGYFKHVAMVKLPVSKHNQVCCVDTFLTFLWFNVYVLFV